MSCQCSSNNDYLKLGSAISICLPKIVYTCIFWQLNTSWLFITFSGFSQMAQRNWRYTETEILQRNLNKQRFYGCDRSAPASDNWKKFTDFSRMFKMLNFCVFGALLRDKILMGAFCLCIVHNRLVNARIVKTCDWILIFMFHFGKSVTGSRFLHFLWFYLFGWPQLISQPIA